MLIRRQSSRLCIFKCLVVNAQQLLFDIRNVTVACYALAVEQVQLAQQAYQAPRYAASWRPIYLFAEHHHSRLLPAAVLHGIVCKAPFMIAILEMTVASCGIIVTCSLQIAQVIGCCIAALGLQFCSSPAINTSG